MIVLVMYSKKNCQSAVPMNTSRPGGWGTGDEQIFVIVLGPGAIFG